MYRCFEKKAPRHLVDQAQPAEESDKTSINELFVAMTRELSSLTICETNPRNNGPLFEESGLDLYKLNSESQEEKLATITFAGLEDVNEDELIARVEACIEKGQVGVAQAIILHNICKGDEELADERWKEFVGENDVSQEKGSENTEFDTIKINKGHQRSRKKRKVKQEDVNQESDSEILARAGRIERELREESLREEENARKRQLMMQGEDDGWMNRALIWGLEKIGWDEDSRRRQQRQTRRNNGGGFTSRASRALVGFLAIGAGGYFSGMFRGNKPDIKEIDISDDTADAIFSKLDCGNLENHDCDKIIYDAVSDYKNHKYYIKLLKRFGELNFDFTRSLTPEGETAAHIAASSGNVGAMKVLNEYVDFSALENDEGLNPFYYASSHRQLEVLKTMLDLGYDFTHEIEAFIQVIKLSNTEVINMLIDRKSVV